MVGISHLLCVPYNFDITMELYSEMFETFKNKSLLTQGNWMYQNLTWHTKHTKYKGENLDVLSKDHPCA
jgi:hypothetical protein